MFMQDYIHNNEMDSTGCLQSESSLKTSIQTPRDMSLSMLTTDKVQHFDEDLQNSELKEALNIIDSITISVGVIIGNGIFVLTGPAVILSLLLTVFTSIFVALSYKISSLFPISGGKTNTILHCDLDT
ncbi:15334_t:CDS:2 [Cetraspora pellucida]|uniref:15334_t:CDS:1 n=1 Tax=Cetraspora pellucida TaxID=1433469 RepID=A0A9N9K0V0_9GLOM|nr:15334_t:CDS:2 [Cetraspora pellucida]